MLWIPPLNGIAMCENVDVLPGNEEGIPERCYTDWGRLGQEGFSFARRGRGWISCVCKKLSRVQFEHFMKCHPRCIIAMEACGSAHHWGRLIAGFCHAVSPVYAKKYLKRHKNDAADAEAIAEAASLPTMRFVAVKSQRQQAQAMAYRSRDMLVRQRTQLINALVLSQTFWNMGLLAKL